VQKADGKLRHANQNNYEEHRINADSLPPCGGLLFLLHDVFLGFWSFSELYSHTPPYVANPEPTIALW
jgi:hypothetical protein